MHLAIKNNHINIIKLLLEYKPNLNLTNNKEEKPIDLATEEIKRLLDEHIHNNNNNNFNNDNNNNNI